MAHPLLCVTVAAPSIDDLRRQRDEAAGTADLVELRLDALRSPDVAGALEGRRGPVIVTCRPLWEGGGFDGPEEVRLAWLEEAVRRGAEWVDVEWRARHAPIVALRGGRGIVVSSHDFEAMPADLEGRYQAMRATSAEVVKLAGRARCLGDTLPLLSIGRGAAAAGEQAVLVAMGAEGLPTRLLPARFGSCWSYAGDAIAPGQVTAGRMLSEFRYREVGAETRLFGLVGRPIAHSLSPAMHNAAFRSLGIDAVYVPFEARDASDFVKVADAFGIEGVSITAPYKVPLLDAVTEVDAESRAVGAINTMRVSGGAWHGRNTDVGGFLAPLGDVDLQGTRAAVLGTGGAARAVVFGLRSRGANVTLYGRDLERATAVALASASVEARAGMPPRGSWDLLVNTTPVGTFPDTEASPVRADLLSGGTVYDLVYNPARTRLLRDAAAAGCRVIGGLEMLIAQAAAQFEWWTGTRAPAEVMAAAARARLSAMTGVE